MARLMLILLLFLFSFLFSLFFSAPTSGFEFYEDFQDKYRWMSRTEVLGYGRYLELGEDRVIEVKDGSWVGFRICDFAPEELLDAYRNLLYLEFRIKVNKGKCKCLFFATGENKTYEAGYENFGVIFSDEIQIYNGRKSFKFGENEKKWYWVVMLVNFEEKKFQVYLNGEDAGIYSFSEKKKSTYFVFKTERESEALVDEVYVIGGKNSKELRDKASLISREEWERIYEIPRLDLEIVPVLNNETKLNIFVKNIGDRDVKVNYRFYVDEDKKNEREVEIEKRGIVVLNESIEGKHRVEVVLSCGAEVYRAEKRVFTPIVEINLTRNRFVYGEDVVFEVYSNFKLNVSIKRANTTIQSLEVFGNKTVELKGLEVGRYVIDAKLKKAEFEVLAKIPVVEVSEIIIEKKNEFVYVSVLYRNVGLGDYEGLLSIQLDNETINQTSKIKAYSSKIVDFGWRKLGFGEHVVRADGKIKKFELSKELEDYRLEVNTSIAAEKLLISGRAKEGDVLVKIYGLQLKDFKVVESKGEFKAEFETKDWERGNYTVVVEDAYGMNAVSFFHLDTLTNKTTETDKKEENKKIEIEEVGKNSKSSKKTEEKRDKSVKEKPTLPKTPGFVLLSILVSLSLAIIAILKIKRRAG